MEQIKTEATVPLHPALVALIAENTQKPSEIEIGEGDDKLVIAVAPMVTATKRAGAIVCAADLVFNDLDSGIDGYMPAFLQFAHRYGVLQCYTNMEIPQELSTAWPLIMYTPIYDQVKEIVGEDTVFEFACQLDELIEARKQERIHAVNVNRLLETLSGIADGFGEQFKGLDLAETLKMFQNLPKSEGGLGGLENIIKTFLNSDGDLQTNQKEE